MSWSHIYLYNCVWIGPTLWGDPPHSIPAMRVQLLFHPHTCWSRERTNWSSIDLGPQWKTNSFTNRHRIWNTQMVQKKPESQDVPWNLEKANHLNNMELLGFHVSFCKLYSLVHELKCFGWIPHVLPCQYYSNSNQFSSQTFPKDGKSTLKVNAVPAGWQGTMNLTTTSFCSVSAKQFHRSLVWWQWLKHDKVACSLPMVVHVCPETPLVVANSWRIQKPTKRFNQTHSNRKNYSHHIYVLQPRII